MRENPQEADGGEAPASPSAGAAASSARARLRDLFAADDEQYAGRRRLLSPFEVFFSQSHIRPEFQDGRPVHEAVDAVDHQQLGPLRPQEADELQVIGAPAGPDDWWLLIPPFPEIEVIQWRCKLREEDGSVSVDSAGNELYGEREWYTLDNRRLYCLQKAATARHPAQVRCPVLVIQQEEGNCREFRKFRTPDRGRTVGVGHRDASDNPRWNWRHEVGLADEVLSAGVALAPRRGPTAAQQGRRRWPNGGKYRGQCYDEEEEDSGQWELARNISIFVLVYASLRLVFFGGRHLMELWNRQRQG